MVGEYNGSMVQRLALRRALKDLNEQLEKLKVETKLKQILEDLVLIYK